MIRNPQFLRLLLQVLLGGAVTHDQEYQILVFLLGLGKQFHQFSQVLFGAQAAQVQHHLLVVPDTQGPALFPPLLGGQTLMVLLQADAAGNNTDRAVNAIAVEGVLHLLGGSHHSFHFFQPLPGQHPYQHIAHPLAGHQVAHILLVKRMVGMYDGRTGEPGDPGGELEAEELALAVNHIRPPVDKLLDQLMVECGGHPHIGIHHSQGQGTDIIHRAVLVGMHVIGKGQNTHVVALGLQFAEQVLHRGNHAVGVGGI